MSRTCPQCGTSFAICHDNRKNIHCSVKCAGAARRLPPRGPRYSHPRRRGGPKLGSRIVHRCGCCGEQGHNERTCPDPRAREL